MAGNEGHPFFGNQYARSCYTGGYQYDWKPNSSVTDVFKQSAKSVSDNIKGVSSSTALPQSESKILPRVSKIGNDGKGAISMCSRKDTFRGCFSMQKAQTSGLF